MVDLPVHGVVSEGTAIMNSGRDYTVSADMLTAKVPARWGALFVTR